jgi:hypothetical protein
MHEICRHLQTLLRQVYCEVYGAKPEDVEFIFIPMPRLEIETIQDFKILHEIGALTPDMTVKLSRILLGEDPSHKRAKPTPQAQVMQGSEPLPERPQKPVAGSKETARPPPK